MEKAIEVMRGSVPEPRDDGKKSPKVGAVLVKPDGTVETACRGELRYGDHAEYTLLERKNRGKRLDGSTLFVTLEPCAPGARRHPKLSCAERIQLARISEIWVGIEDPDPTVARKGIVYLERSGVQVHLFDRDLQEVIEHENREFLAQALERARTTRDQPTEIVLSPMENPLPSATVSVFSERALESYRNQTAIAEPSDSEQFYRRLLDQGLLKRDGESLIPTGFGTLLFGEEPRRFFRQAGLMARIEYPGDEYERQEFDGPLVLIPELVENWLRDKLPNVFVRDTMYRQERSSLPFEMIREALVNALVHRDYAIEGAKCQLIVNQHTVTVLSPGEPPSPVTLEQLQSLDAPMLSRNPEIHFVFSRMGMAEEQGIGLSSLKKRALDSGLPLPAYSWHAPYLKLTLFRSSQAVVSVLNEDILAELTDSELRGYEWLSGKGEATQAEYSEAMGVTARTAQRHLKKFRELGILKKEGAGAATRYRTSIHGRGAH